MDKEFTCFFTGHRIIGGNISAYVKNRIEYEAQTLINDKGVTDFITGGALGFDTIAAQTIIRLKEKYDYIKLHLYLPCYNQMQNWKESDQYTGRIIMSYADSKIYTTQTNYFNGCMQIRNRKMANDSTYCIAYMKNSRSGTSYTISYAKSIGCKIINIGDEL